MLRRLASEIVIAAAIALLLAGCGPFMTDYGPTPGVKWRVHIGSTPDTRISAPAAVAGGLVFVPASELHERWRFAIKYAAKTAPLVEDAIVYVGDARGDPTALVVP